MTSPLDSSRLVLPDAGVDFHALATLRWGEPPEPEPDESLFLAPRCRLHPRRQPVGPSFSDADASDPRIKAARELLDAWPEARDGIGELVTEFWPLEDSRVGPASRGCSSGHEILDGNRAAYVTIHDPYGCFDGLLHEYGHLRHLTLGVGLETHDGELLAHGDEERYPSPIRRDKLRPMSAVLHGVYCWTLFSEGDIRLASASDEAREAVVGTLTWNLPKIEDGILVFERWARWSAGGQAFGERLVEWARDVVERGWQVVGEDRREAAVSANREWVVEQPASASELHGIEMSEEMPR